MQGASKNISKGLRLKNGNWVIEQTSLNPKGLGCRSATVYLIYNVPEVPTSKSKGPKR